MPVITNLCSIIIIEEAAGMVISPILEGREISHIASLAVLGHSVGVRSSSDDDRASQVDSAGITTIYVLLIIITTVTS